MMSRIGIDGKFTVTNKHTFLVIRICFRFIFVINSIQTDHKKRMFLVVAVLDM